MRGASSTSFIQWRFTDCLLWTWHRVAPPAMPPHSYPPGKGDGQVEVKKFVVISPTTGLCARTKVGSEGKGNSSVMPGRGQGRVWGQVSWCQRKRFELFIPLVAEEDTEQKGGSRKRSSSHHPNLSEVASSFKASRAPHFPVLFTEVSLMPRTVAGPECAQTIVVEWVKKKNTDTSSVPLIPNYLSTSLEWYTVASQKPKKSLTKEVYSVMLIHVLHCRKDKWNYLRSR